MILRIHRNQHPRRRILFAVGSGRQYLPDNDSSPLKQRIRNLPALADCGLHLPQIPAGMCRVS
jgi:hypothetical protein